MASNRKRLTELSMVPAVAAELGAQIDGATKNAKRLMELGVSSALARRLVVQMTAGVGNSRALGEVGMVPALAKEVAAQISGGTPTPTPGLRAGYSLDLDLSKPSAYAGGVFPADGAAVASVVDQVSAAAFNRTSAATAANFVLSAANSLPGVRWTGGSTALTMLNAARPTNYFNQAAPGKCCSHFLFTNAGSGSSALLAYNGSSGYSNVTTSPVTGAGLGVGQTQSGVAGSRANMTDTGTHLLTIVSTSDTVTTQTGTGMTQIFLDGVCVAAVGNTTGVIGGGADLVLGSTVAAGGNGWTGTLLRHIYYPDVASEATVWTDAQYLLGLYGKTLPTKHIIFLGNSLTMGTTAYGGSYTIPGALNVQLGIVNAPQVHNLGLGGINNLGMAVMMDRAIALYQAIAAGGGTAEIWFAEGHNSLQNAGTSADQAVDGGGGAGGIGMIGLARKLATAGIPYSKALMWDVTGVATIRAGYAKYPQYAARIAGIITTYPELAGLKLVSVATDPNLGLAGEGTSFPASTSGGFYGITGVVGVSGGSDGLGHNSDGYDGLTAAATAGTAGDGVHRFGQNGYIIGGTGTISGYPLLADRKFRTLAITALA